MKKAGILALASVMMLSVILTAGCSKKEKEEEAATSSVVEKIPVEEAAPIEEPALKERIMHIFRTELADNVKAREQRANGAYKKKKLTEADERVNSQEIFYEEAYRAAQLR